MDGGTGAGTDAGTGAGVDPVQHLIDEATREVQEEGGLELMTGTDILSELSDNDNYLPQLENPSQMEVMKKLLFIPFSVCMGLGGVIRQRKIEQICYFIQRDDFGFQSFRTAEPGDIGRIIETALSKRRTTGCCGGPPPEKEAAEVLGMLSRKQGKRMSAYSVQYITSIKHWYNGNRKEARRESCIDMNNRCMEAMERLFRNATGEPWYKKAILILQVNGLLLNMYWQLSDPVYSEKQNSYENIMKTLITKKLIEEKKVQSLSGFEWDFRALRDAKREGDEELADIQLRYLFLKYGSVPAVHGTGSGGGSSARGRGGGRGGDGDGGDGGGGQVRAEALVVPVEAQGGGKRRSYRKKRSSRRSKRSIRRRSSRRSNSRRRSSRRGKRSIRRRSTSKRKLLSRSIRRRSSSSRSSRRSKKRRANRKTKRNYRLKGGYGN